MTGGQLPPHQQRRDAENLFCGTGSGALGMSDVSVQEAQQRTFMVFLNFSWNLASFLRKFDIPFDLYKCSGESLRERSWVAASDQFLLRHGKDRVKRRSGIGGDAEIGFNMISGKSQRRCEL